MRRGEAELRDTPSLSFEERHYTVAEIAIAWNISKDAARSEERRLEQNETAC
jgi:hypothetical protein